MKIVDIVCWILNGLVLASLIYSYVLRRKTKKIVAEILAVSNENVEIIKSCRERVDLLSKENNKLREKNEELKERLANLGFKE